MSVAFLVSVATRHAVTPLARRAECLEAAALTAQLPELVEGALRPWPTAQARVRRHGREGLPVVLADALPLVAMLTVVSAACRGDEWAIGVYIDPPADPRLAALRVAEQAQRSPWGVAVRIDRTDPTTTALDAALAMYVTLLRQRSPLCWRALDAVAAHGTATAAASALGCSQQAVSAHLKRSNHDATRRITLLVEQLLAGR